MAVVELIAATTTTAGFVGILHQDDAAGFLHGPYADRAVGPGAGQNDRATVPVPLRQRTGEQVNGCPLPARLLEFRGGDFVTTGLAEFGSAVSFRSSPLVSAIRQSHIHFGREWQPANATTSFGKEISVWLISKPISRAVVPHVGPWEHCVANRDILTIGTSAGGFEALRFLAGEFSPDFPASVLVVIHLPSQFRSTLDAILTQAGPLPATFAVDGEKLTAGIGAARP